jgi:hypothetical protein
LASAKDDDVSKNNEANVEILLSKLTIPFAMARKKVIYINAFFYVL